MTNLNTIRIVVLGGSRCGKTAVTVRYLTKRYIGEYSSTTDFLYRTNVTFDNVTTQLEILDTCKCTWIHQACSLHYDSAMIPQLMEFCFKLVLFLLALTVQSSQKNPAFQLSNSEEERQISFVTTLCKETVDMSQQALFYVLNMNPDFPIQSFIRNLHENLIGTVLITNHIWLHYSAVRQPTRNIIIFLNELDEIPSLILDSASASDETAIDQAKRTPSPKLNQYCIQNDDFDLIDVNKTCDFTLHIRRSELNGDSDLTNSLSKLTRGLFANRIWNSNNYIIFMLPLISTKGRHNIREHQLAFLFKFFWRFFKGLRTTLCIGLTCYNHDAFLNGSPGRAFQVGVLYVPRVYLYGGDTDPGYWRTLDYVTTDLKDELKCNIGLTEVANPKYIIRTFESNHIDLHEKALKLNLDMFIFEATNFPLRDVSMFDFSAAIQSCSFCFATPRSGFVPQSILPFKCFSLEVWTVILIAVLTILAAIYIFHYLQRTRFNLLYSERERLTFEHTSVILYLYSFLTIGSPSRLLLGRVVTGKILFLIVSFFVLIVVTVLQSQMTTLLSKSLRYPEIDTLEDLSNSNLFIQTQDMETSLERLQDYSFYNSLKNKLTEGTLLLCGHSEQRIGRGDVFESYGVLVYDLRKRHFECSGEKSCRDNKIQFTVHIAIGCFRGCRL
ncbi:uncharacterized protein [Bemisia tabaci]